MLNDTDTLDPIIDILNAYRSGTLDGVAALIDLQGVFDQSARALSECDHVYREHERTESNEYPCIRCGVLTDNPHENCLDCDGTSYNGECRTPFIVDPQTLVRQMTIGDAIALRDWVRQQTPTTLDERESIRRQRSFLHALIEVMQGIRPPATSITRKETTASA